VVRRVEGAAGAAAETAAPAASQRRHGVAGAAQELPAGRVAAGAVAARGRAAASHQEGADGDGRRRGGWGRVRLGRAAAAGDAAAAQLPFRRHAHAPGRRLRAQHVMIFAFCFVFVG